MEFRTPCKAEFPDLLNAKARHLKGAGLMIRDKIGSTDQISRLRGYVLQQLQRVQPHPSIPPYAHVQPEQPLPLR